MESVGVLPSARNLDAAQRAAVEQHRTSPLLVIGPPGSGKTTMVAAAAALELAGRSPGDPQPLVLTFSRRAASQLRNRVARALNRTVSPPWVTTVHAFCLWLLRRAATPGAAEPRLLTAPEQEFRVRELLAGRGAEVWPSDVHQAVGTRAFARQVRAAIARVRQLGMDPDDVVAAGERAGRGEWVSVGRFFAEYLDVLDHEGSLDYAELVHRARIVLADEPLAAAVRGEISRVIVDEYGELDPAQIGLLRSLVGPGGPILATGDPDQVVFRFRGAHPRGLADFPQTFRTVAGGPAPVLALDGSHRGGPGLTAAWRRVARRLPLPVLGDAATRVLREGGDAVPGPQVRTFVCASESEQAQLIA
ncbi:MAG: UvrD-helicase domain-containing protein, partial [Micropruina sp.]|uniref:UvrD-helicase domain-containing protein n=1 Tax=Micropruina sp. TaxID=2737536 RepID=UPI0039E290CE